MQQNRYNDALRFLATCALSIFLGVSSALAQQADDRDGSSSTPPSENLDRQLPNQPPASEQNESKGMNLQKLTAIIKELGESVENSMNGPIAFTYEGAQLIAIVSEPANRMRLISPVINANDLSESQMAAALVSNYHLALDARYAVGDGILYSVFIHPLKELTDEQLRSAIRQVATLRNTFGTTYSSGELTFGIEQTAETIEL